MLFSCPDLRIDGSGGTACHEPPRFIGGGPSLALVAGPVVFLAAGVAGAIFAGGFFAYPPGFAKPAILFIEAFMVLSIAVTLPMLVAGPPRREPRR